VDELISRGGDATRFGKRLSFFFYVHMDLFEEVAKFRAARRIWARLMKERYGVTDPKAQHFRFGVVCGGSSLTAAQPYNNIVRVSVETLAAVMGGAQSIFTCAFDEAFQIPTEFSAEIALRTQQIVAYESGVGRTVDPLGGSYAVEYLTDRMEEEILKVIGEIDAYGGVVKAIEDGWLQMRIAERARERKDKRDSGESVVVGHNFFGRPEDKAHQGEVFRLDPQLSQRVLDKYRSALDHRDNAVAQRSLAALRSAAAKDRENLMPYLVDCSHAYTTVGEMVRELKAEWGEFQEPIRL
jgi:methylmalonyl-CoA mutase N-terminal domain/subunit